MTAVLFKTDFGGDIRRLPLPDEASFAKLRNVLGELYGLSDFSIKYQDEDNELITISSDLELTEAISICKTMGLKAVRLIVLAKPSPSSSSATTTEAKTEDGKDKAAKKAEKEARKAEKEARKAEKEAVRAARQAEREAEKALKEAKKAEREAAKAAAKAKKAPASDGAGAGASAPETEAKEDSSSSSSSLPQEAELRQLLLSLLSDAFVIAALPKALSAGLAAIDPARLPLSSKAIIEAALEAAPGLAEHPAAQRLLPFLPALYPQIDECLSKVTAEELSMFLSMAPLVLPALPALLQSLPALLSGVPSLGDPCHGIAGLPFLAPFLAALGLGGGGMPCSGPAAAAATGGDENETEAEAEAVHRNIVCDGCGVTPLRGIRYKCSVCPDYDLCEACEGRNVHPNHALLKIRKPRHGHHGGHGHGHHFARGPFGGFGGWRGGHHGHHGHGFGHGHGHHWRNMARAFFGGAGAGAGAEAATQTGGDATADALQQQQPQFGGGWGYGEGWGHHGHRHHHRGGMGGMFGMGGPHRRPRGEYVKDTNLPDGSDAAAGPQTKTWVIRNIGRHAWPEGVKLLRVGGAAAVESAPEVTLNATPAPGEEVEVSLPFTLPEKPGRYTVHFRLATAEGVVFGPRLWLDLCVKEPVTATTPSAPAPEVKAEAEPEPAAPAPSAPSAEAEAEAAPAKPAESEAEADSKWSLPLSLLASMGFTDGALNAYLLERHQGNLQQVVDFLLGNAGRD